MKNKGNIKLGINCLVERGAIVGYKPGRKIKNLSLCVGDNAQIRSGSVIYAGSNIGANLATGHNVVIREENRVGGHLSIWNNSVIDYGCKVGNNVKIHSNVYIAQFTTIEDNVFIAPGVSIANDIHPGCKLSSRCMKGPVIKRGAQIGVNVTILPFITIGEGAVIGAGSVVTHDIPSYCIAYGNPARVHNKTKNLRCITGLTGKPYQR